MTFRIVTVAACLFLAGPGCREIRPLENDKLESPAPTPETFSGERLAFNVSGVEPNYRIYSSLYVAYDGMRNETLIESRGDSVSQGKLTLRLQGGRTGEFRYDVKGAATDVNELYLQYVVRYSGSQPTTVFELTGFAADSLEGVATVTRFGAIGDTVAGTFSAYLKLSPPSIQARVYLYNGVFKGIRRK